MNIAATEEEAWHGNVAPQLSPQIQLSTMTGRQRFLSACACRRVDCTPVWLMRQAGRCLPEYRALKEKYTFLQLVQTPELASEVTLQPIRRFGFDAAILFSDILVVAEALGQGYRFRETGGIVMDFALSSARDIAALQTDAVTDRLQYVAQALPLIKQAMKGKTALLGFAGSPWTLANFMLEGGSAKKFTKVEALLHSDPALFFALMEKLALAVADFLQMQIDSGVDAIQIFDSLGGLLPEDMYEAASGRWIRAIVASLRGQVPVIAFSRETKRTWRGLLQTGAQVLGVDWNMSLATLRTLMPDGMALQGNINPAILTTTPELVAEETTRVLREIQGTRGHILNLGHGVPANAKLENIESLVATARSFK